MDAEAFGGSRSLAFDKSRLGKLFGRDESPPLWIAESYVPLAESIRSALQARADAGWYGYESRPDTAKAAFWEWMVARHGWSNERLTTIVSPSVGTSIGVMIDALTDEGDGVVIQPPVFTDFKPLISASGRTVVRNRLLLTDGGYQMDLDGLAEVTASPAVRVMILCNPHNPVGKLWSEAELEAVARICADNGVSVIADEIHADLALPPNVFVPFATVAEGSGVAWAATHGPTKMFGLAGVRSAPGEANAPSHTVGCFQATSPALPGVACRPTPARGPSMAATRTYSEMAGARELSAGHASLSPAGRFGISGRRPRDPRSDR
jgi:cystathionine beta-lyase